MSDANREQMQELVNSMWNTIAGSVAEARGIDLETLNRITDKLEVSLPEDALEHGFVDSLLYEDQMNDVFAELGVQSDSDGQYNFVTWANMRRRSVPTSRIFRPTRLLSYMPTVRSSTARASAARLSAIRWRDAPGVRADEKVKAVVLRVNSPGGSAWLRMSSGAKWSCSRPRNPSSSRWVPMRPAADTTFHARPMSLWPTN